jgi:hypothetical protein
MSRTFSTNNRIAGEFEGLNAMRLQPESLPDAMYSRGGAADLLAHRPQAPVRRPLWTCLQRLADRGCDFTVADLAWRAGARLVVEAIKPLRRKTIAPCTGRRSTDTDPDSNLFVVEALSGSQNNPRPLRQCLRRAVFTRQRRQFALLRGFQYDRHRTTLRHSRLPA